VNIEEHIRKIIMETIEMKFNGTEGGKNEKFAAATP